MNSIIKPKTHLDLDHDIDSPVIGKAKLFVSGDVEIETVEQIKELITQMLDERSDSNAAHLQLIDACSGLLAADASDSQFVKWLDAITGLQNGYRDSMAIFPVLFAKHES